MSSRRSSRSRGLQGSSSSHGGGGAAHSPVLTHVFRNMRRDFDDLSFVPKPNTYGLTKADDKLRVEVLDAVLNGSRVRSRFLHCTATVQKANEWHSRADAWEPNQLGLMVRIDLARVGYENVIDLSTEKAAKAFFNKPPDAYGPWFEDSFSVVIGRAYSIREVLIMWRGKVDIDAFDVVYGTGLVISKLRDVLEGAKVGKKTSSRHRSAPPVHPCPPVLPCPAITYDPPIAVSYTHLTLPTKRIV